MVRSPFNIDPFGPIIAYSRSNPLPTVQAREARIIGSTACASVS